MFSETKAQFLAERIRAKFGPCDVHYEPENKRMVFCVPSSAIGWLVHYFGAGYILPATREDMLTYIVTDD